MAKPRVVTRPQVDKSTTARSARPYRQNPVGERECTEDLPVKREVDTIFGGPCKVGKSHRTRDRYALEVRYPPWAMVHVTNAYPTRGIILKPKDIVFTKADVNWVNHPHEDALVVTTKISNNLVHMMLVDNGSAINILYWDTYQKTRLTRADLSSMTSPYTGFLGIMWLPNKLSS